MSAFIKHNPAPYSKVGPEVQRMFNRLSSRYDITNTVLSFGIHHLWKRATVNYVCQLTNPSPSAPVLDLCTGTADIVDLFMKKCISVIGADFAFSMLSQGRSKLPGANLIQADAAKLPFKSEHFSALTVAFGVRNLEDLDCGLLEMRRVLVADGLLAILEFGCPTFEPWKAAFALYSNHILPLIGGLLTNDRAAYKYLRDTSAEFPSGAAFEECLKKAGFKPLLTKPLSGGIAWLYLARREET